MLDVSELRVRYRGFKLGPVDLNFDEGDFVSLIGPNGSGKSTLISALLGLNRNIVSGNVELFGESAMSRPRHLFAEVGYVSDSSQDVLSEFTPREYWEYCRMAYERSLGQRITDWDERAEYYASLLDFPIEQKRSISALSLGTVRKVQIIAALLPKPRFVVFDEPFIGLDFISSRSFEEILHVLNKAGTTVLASSHDLDLAARVANRIVVLHLGRIRLDSEVSALENGVEAAVHGALREARQMRLRR